MADPFVLTPQHIIDTASAIGMPPEMLATIISYESGFNPNIWGGKGGKHHGLIQFGEPERAAYGVRVGDPMSQLGKEGAIAKYFLGRGWKPGMSELDAYSIVNAGSPGRYSASDTAAGGAPGNVYDKVTQQFGPHRERAANFLKTGQTGLRHVGGAGSGPGYFAPKQYDLTPKKDNRTPLSDPSAGDKKDKDKKGGLGAGLEAMSDAFGNAIQDPARINTPQNQDMGGGAPMASFFRPQLMPTSVGAGVGGMGGGQDMRQLLAMLMQGG